jgi:hypothetical protein
LASSSFGAILWIHGWRENTKLKKLLAEAMLDNAMLKDIAAKKW